jgi:hypothetical protein
MKTEPTLIPPTGAVSTSALSSLERALAKCQEEAVTAFTSANGQPYVRDQKGNDSTDKHFTRGIALMKVTAKLAGAMAKLNSHCSQTHFVHRTEVRTLQSPPEPALIAPAEPGAPVASLQYDDPCPVSLFDATGKTRTLTPEEEQRFTQWYIREEARIARKRAEQGAPSPNLSGSNGDHGPCVRLP